VRALSGFREDDISTTVEIGGGSDNVVIRVTANPTTLGPGDFSSEIVATLTDNRGNPLADDPVIFSTDAGALASAGSVLRTNASGQAFDRLTLLANEDSATVTVTSGSAVPGTVNVTRGDFGDPLIDSVSPSSGVRGASLIVTVTGQRFQPGVTASFGTGIAIDDVDWISSETLRIRIRIDPSASTGARTVTVTNPDGESASLASAFVVQ
jgi:hypothetical protein